MKKNFLLNPFERIAGWQALGWGLSAIIVAAVIGNPGGLRFDGAIDAHFHPTGFSMGRAVAMHLIDWLGITVVMLLAASIFYRGKFRVIDIAGTMALARVPTIGIALFALLPITPPEVSFLPQWDHLAILMIVGLIFLCFAIWMIALMWKGFKVSCNARGARGGWVFAIALIVSEISVAQLYVAIGWMPSIREMFEQLNLPL